MKTQQDEMDIFATGIGMTMYRLIQRRDILLGIIITSMVMLTIGFTIFIYILYSKINDLEIKVDMLKNSEKTINVSDSLMRPSLRYEKEVKKSNTVVLDLDEFEVTKTRNHGDRKTVWTRKLTPEKAQWYTYTIVSKK